MTEPRIITAYTAPNLTRVAVVRLQGQDVTVRQSPKKVTTVWLGSVRLTKQHNSSVWHAAAGAAFAEWERQEENTCPNCGQPVSMLGSVNLRADGRVEHGYACTTELADAERAAAEQPVRLPAAEVIREETVEDWDGPALVAVTREYDAPAPAALAAAVQGQTTAQPVAPAAITAAAEEEREVTVTLTRSAADGAAAALRREATRLEEAFAFAGPDAPVRRTIDSLRETATLLSYALDAEEEQEQERPAGAPLPTLQCFHVTVTGGQVYGVAADDRGVARELVYRRLRGEGSAAGVQSIRNVGTWQAEHGTVLAY